MILRWKDTLYYWCPCVLHCRVVTTSWTTDSPSTVTGWYLSLPLSYWQRYVSSQSYVYITHYWWNLYLDLDQFLYKPLWLYELIFFKLMAIVATLILFWQITVDVDHKKAAKRTGRVIDMPASGGDQLQMESGVVTSTAVVWFYSTILCLLETVLGCFIFLFDRL